MKKLCVLCLVLTGCSSNTNWVNAKGEVVEPEALQSAMHACHYKKKMKLSNSMMMRSNTAPPPRDLSYDKDPKIQERNRHLQAMDNRTIRANAAAKKQSMRIAKSAYQCMALKGFLKSDEDKS